MHSIAVYLVNLVPGGAEEGGWYYEAGELCTEPELLWLACLVHDADDAYVRAAELQRRLDAEWNIGEHARPLSSVLSPGRYIARVHEGFPPPYFPPEPPRYE